ncbi:MAG TPA: hypothetical protein VLH56_19595 [Dissulfurispiraceae bacterium]|nr:hypothetical protein [Dissulfurispiraceae bacterium]
MGFPVDKVADNLNRAYGGGIATWKSRVDQLSKAYALYVGKGDFPPFNPYRAAEGGTRIVAQLEKITGYSRSIVTGFLSSLYSLVESGKVEFKWLNPDLETQYRENYGVSKVVSDVTKGATKAGSKILFIGALIAAGAFIINSQLGRIGRTAR